MIYLLCVKEFFKTYNVIFVYLDLKNKQETKIELSENLAKEFEEKLLTISKKIQKKDFIANKKSNFCPCEYNIICY